MGKGRSPRGYLVVVAAALFGLLVSQVAAAGGEGESEGPKARASAVSASKFKKLKKQVQALQRQVDALASQPGPQGPPGAQGPAGTAPVCQGNGSGDTMVAAGAVCVDKYEVSVWSSPTGGTQYGASSDNYPAACTDTGQGCEAGSAGEIYARSVPGVTPSRFITYFQAQAALANVGKHLPSDAQWQQAVAGTPDSTACNVSTGSVAATGTNADCVSNFGAFDMVGNLYEWVRDWVPRSTACPGWGTVVTFASDDLMCLSGASTTAAAPGALLRSGSFNDDTSAGPFTVDGRFLPSGSFFDTGFRGAR
ncbi:MAG TPA: hypothetical protein VLB79_12435 [Solirubrobacterales bacterium]|nr:hypothetical protein [Solirubrobacterales bacterium]